MLNIKSLADLKRELPNITFEQFYNTMNRANPALIPEKVQGKRPVIKVQSAACYIALAAPHDKQNPHGAMWDFPAASKLVFEQDGDAIIMTVNQSEDWIIKYRLERKTS